MKELTLHQKKQFKLEAYEKAIQEGNLAELDKVLKKPANSPVQVVAQAAQALINFAIGMTPTADPLYDPETPLDINKAEKNKNHPFVIAALKGYENIVARLLKESELKLKSNDLEALWQGLIHKPERAENRVAILKVIVNTAASLSKLELCIHPHYLPLLLLTEATKAKSKENEAAFLTLLEDLIDLVSSQERGSDLNLVDKEHKNLLWHLIEKLKSPNSYFETYCKLIGKLSSSPGVVFVDHEGKMPLETLLEITPRVPLTDPIKQFVKKSIQESARKLFEKLLLTNLEYANYAYNSADTSIKPFLATELSRQVKSYGLDKEKITPLLMMLDNITLHAVRVDKDNLVEYLSLANQKELLEHAIKKVECQYALDKVLLSENSQYDIIITLLNNKAIVHLDKDPELQQKKVEKLLNTLKQASEEKKPDELLKTIILQIPLLGLPEIRKHNAIKECIYFFVNTNQLDLLKWVLTEKALAAQKLMLDSALLQEGTNIEIITLLQNAQITVVKETELERLDKKLGKLKDYLQRAIEENEQLSKLDIIFKWMLTLATGHDEERQEIIVSTMEAAALHNNITLIERAVRESPYILSESGNKILVNALSSKIVTLNTIARLKELGADLRDSDFSEEVKGRLAEILIQAAEKGNDILMLFEPFIPKLIASEKLHRTREGKNLAGSDLFIQVARRAPRDADRNGLTFIDRLLTKSDRQKFSLDVNDLLSCFDMGHSIKKVDTFVKVHFMAAEQHLTIQTRFYLHLFKAIFTIPQDQQLLVIQKLLEKDSDFLVKIASLTIELGADKYSPSEYIRAQKSEKVIELFKDKPGYVPEPSPVVVETKEPKLVEQPKQAAEDRSQDHAITHDPKSLEELMKSGLVEEISIDEDTDLAADLGLSAVPPESLPGVEEIDYDAKPPADFHPTVSRKDEVEDKDWVDWEESDEAAVDQLTSWEHDEIEPIDQDAQNDAVTRHPTTMLRDSQRARMQTPATLPVIEREPSFTDPRAIQLDPDNGWVDLESQEYIDQMKGSKLSGRR
jgi:hypothetical protein